MSHELWGHESWYWIIAINPTAKTQSGLVNKKAIPKITELPNNHPRILHNIYAVNLRKKVQLAKTKN